MVNLHLHAPMTQLMVSPCTAHPAPRLFSASHFAYPNASNPEAQGNWKTEVHSSLIGIQYLLSANNCSKHLE